MAVDKTKNQKVSNFGLLDTPPIPEGLPRIELTENSRQVLTKRYLRRGNDGQPVETIEEMFWRVAYHVAKVEELWDGDPIERAKEFYRMLIDKRFFPNSPTFTGAGTPLGQLAACFVLPIEDDMGKTSAGIFQTLRDAALIQQTGGGNGFSFSPLRPKNTIVKSSAGNATGPIGFLRVYDHAFGEVAQGGTRRGANMAVLRVDHPDIEDFITCKSNEKSITNFNISVGITDDFMRAVENDDDWELRFPDVTHPDHKHFKGTLEQIEADGYPILTYKTVRARDIFSQIVKQAHHNGEPGMLFLDAANRSNPVPHLYALEATNPCGEQWLGPYESCCLGSINLSKHIDENGIINWDLLRQDIVLSTIFLDNVVEANAYVPAVPQLRESAHRARRIGLGIMGLADMMYYAGIRYGSPEGQDFGAQVMEFVRYYAMQTSIDLAKSRGSFPAIKDSIYDPENLTWQPPVSILDFQNDYGRPELDWDAISEQIRAYGIRNAAQTTVAPTGTISTVAGCEGYGCEPVFALAYIRHVNDNGKDLKLTYASPAFENALERLGMNQEKRQEVFEQVMQQGSCQSLDDIPTFVRNAFVVSSDITAEEHVRMQAALQVYVDNSLSKTINFPPNATEQDVATAYQLAWELGCKGITVYVTGSRETVVLETHATAKDKEKDTAPVAVPVVASEQSILWSESKKPRPRYLTGFTYQIGTPLGKAFVTINENGEHQPFEVFINSAKAGSDTAAVSEAIARLISYILRLISPVEPSKRLRDVISQMNGIGGGRPMGFGPTRVRSLPDGLAQIMTDYILGREERMAGMSADQQPKNGQKPWVEVPATQHMMQIGDLCPECGEAAFVNEEGCRKCYACGYSEC